MTLRAILITRRAQPGSFKVTFSGNGNQQARSFGFTGNVRTVPLLVRLSDNISNCSWLRQEYSLVSGLLVLSITSD